MSLTATILVFSFMNNQGVIAENRVMPFDSVEACVQMNDQYANSFNKQYPKGAYEGQCVSNGKIVHINQQYANRLISKRFNSCNR